MSRVLSCRPFRDRRGPLVIAVRLSLILSLVVAGLLAAGPPASAAAESKLAWSAPRRALLAQTGQITDVSCVSTTWCLAVDANGNYLTGAKGVWTPPRRAVEGASFTSVSCRTSTYCIATDTVGRAFVYLNGSWGKPRTVFRDSFGTRRVGAIDCVAATFCLAVDNSGYISRWDGTAWGVPLLVIPTSRQTATANVSCASRSRCVAVTSEGRAARFDGAKWRSIAPAFDSVDPALLSCARGTSTCVVVADKTYRLSGLTWVVQSSATPYYASSVQCASATRCVAVGLISVSSRSWYGYTFDGTTWTATEITADYSDVYGRVAVSCTSNLGLCEGVGSTQELWRQANGNWSGTTLIDPINTTVTSVSCATRTSCVLAGDHVVTRYDGSSWSTPLQVVQDSGPTALTVNVLTDVSCASPTFCSVGAELIDDVVGSPQVYVTDGRTATRAKGSGALNVSCPSSTFCGGISRVNSFDLSTEAAVYTKGAWGPPSSVPSGPVSSISCVSSTFCIAVGADGENGVNYYRYNGSTWTLTSATIAGDQTAKVSCATTTFCVATSEDGFASVFNGTKWSAPKQVTSSLGEIDCASTTFCLASANLGQVVEFDGSAWATPVTVSDERIVDVSCPTTTNCVAADVDGKVVFGK